MIQISRQSGFQRMTLHRWCRVIALLLGVAGAPSWADVVVGDAYVRGLPPTQKNTAAFFLLSNTGDRAVTLTAGSSPAAQTLEIHSHAHRDGMMAMRMQPSVSLAPGAQLRFAPGGLHLMLLNLQQPLKDGDKVSFTLLVDGEPLAVIAPVVSVLKANPVMGHH